MFFCVICFGAVVTESYTSPDGVTVEKLDSNRLVLTNAANSIDGSLIQTASIPVEKLNANANTVNRWNESFNDFVYTGLIVPTSDDLDSTTTSGIAYINGVRVVKDATPHTYNDTLYTYLDLSDNGTYTYSETAIGGAVPSVALNSIRLMVVSTDGTKVHTISDERTTIVTLGTESAISLVDTDQDTQVQVEKNSDEDIIRFDINGVEQIIIQDGEILPTTDDDVNLGSSSKQFKDLHIDGTANIDSLNADSLVATTADINGGTIDGVTIGGSVAPTTTDIGTVAAGTWQGTDIALGYGGIGSKKIDSGTITIAASSTDTITFNFTFGANPVVVCTFLENTDSNIGALRVKTVSTTQATVFNIHNQEVQVNWIAIGAE